MSEIQGATRPAWQGRGTLRLLADVIGGFRQNLDKVVQLAGLFFALFRPRKLRARLERLRELGHIDVVPNLAQLLVAGRDQMIVSVKPNGPLLMGSEIVSRTPVSTGKHLKQYMVESLCTFASCLYVD